MVRRTWGLRTQLMLRRWRRFTVDMLQADDPPGKLALGAGIGMFITFTPTVGFQMVLTLFFAWLLRANKTIGLPIVWISNPVTIIPIFYGCYVLGRIMMGYPEIEQEWWAGLSSPPEAWGPKVQFYWYKLMDIAVPLWVGCLVVATITGYITYLFVYYAVRNYRMRRWGQLTPPTKTQV